MRPTWKRLLALTAWTLALLVGSTVSAFAQDPPVRSLSGSNVSATGRSNLAATTPSTEPMAVAIYANPYMNPWINPMLAPGQYSRADMGWYLFAGQQATMGLGTGRLSGIRNAPQAKPPREVTMPLASRVPGANARSYFQRGSTSGRPAAPIFQRNNGNFQSNGH